MHTPPAASAAVAAVGSTPESYVVRLSGGLAALLGRAEGVEIPEDDLLGMLREAGLVTYPSPLLVPLLEEWPDVLAAEVFARLDPTDCAVLAQVGQPWLAVVVANNLPRARGRGGRCRSSSWTSSGQPSGWLGRRRTTARGMR